MDDERALIKRILPSDTDAWQTFIEIYSPCIRKAIERHVKDPELASDLYVNLLEKLKTSKLGRFDSRSSLSTWLFVVARNHCRDFYRSTNGVRHLLTALKGLGDAERRFFKLHYIQGLSLQETFESMRLEAGGSISYLDIFDYRETIKSAIAAKHLGRLLDRLLRPESELMTLAPGGADSSPDRAEMLESACLSPETYIDGKNLRIAVDNLRSAILRLPHRDQLVLKLRFEHKRSAREISEILDLGSEKRVYRRLEKLYGELRCMLREGDLAPDTYGEITEDIEDLCKYTGVWDTEPHGDNETAS